MPYNKILQVTTKLSDKVVEQLLKIQNYWTMGTLLYYLFCLLYVDIGLYCLVLYQYFFY